MTAKQTAATGLPERVTGAFFRWELQDEAIVVDLHRNVIELLERDVMRARGKVAAGLLLGRVSRGRLLSLMVEHYEPVTPERGVSGTPFADRERMETMVSRWRPGQSRLSVIGLYRSCTTQDAFLTNDDLSAMAANFQRQTAEIVGIGLEGANVPPQAANQPATDPEDFERVFLLIDPTSGGTSRKAVLHITRGGTVVWQSPPTPFNRQTISTQGGTNQSQVSEMRSPSVVPEQPMAQVREEASEEPKKDPKKISVMTWGIISLVVVVLLVAGYFQLHGTLPSRSLFPNITTASGDANLGLKLDQSGVAAWRLSWSSDSIVDMKATTGRLVVTDGAMHKTIDLDESDLRGGTIVYSPITQDVILRLEVDSPDSSKPVSESVRTVGGLLPGVSTPQVSAALPPSPDEVPSQLPASLAVEPAPKPDVKEQPVIPVPPSNEIPVRTPAARPLAQPEIARNRPPMNVEVKAPEKRPIIASRLEPQPSAPRPDFTRTSKPAGIVSQPSPAPINVIPARTAELRPPAQPEISKSRAPLNVDVKVPEKRPIIASRLEPRATAPKPDFARTSRPVGIVSQPQSPALPGIIQRGGVVQIAQLISKKDPDYPLPAKEARLSGSVEVKFKIDTDGEVRDAMVSKGPSLLASAAIEAVQEWRYKPARLDGVPVATQGSAVIVFKMN